jgi:ribosomal protein S18 acetylase RimI-like enzyme
MVVHAWDRDAGRTREIGKRPEPGEVILRNARDSDFGTLRDLWRELMDLHVELDPRFTLSENADQRFFNYLETARSREDYRVRIAAVDDQPVGFAISCVLPNSPVYRARWIGYINDLCVTSSMRRRGIGELLVRDAVDWLRSNGAETVEVYVARYNEGAQRFWRRIGGREYLERLSLDLSRYPEER